MTLMGALYLWLTITFGLFTGCLAVGLSFVIVKWISRDVA